MWFPSSEVYFFLKMAKRYAKLRQGSLQQRKDDDEDTNVQIHKWRESRKGLHVTTGWLQNKLHISRLTPPMLHHLAWVLQRKRTQCWHQLSWGKKKEGKKMEMHVYGKVLFKVHQISLLWFSWTPLKVTSLWSPAVCKDHLTNHVPLSLHEDLTNRHFYHKIYLVSFAIFENIHI